MPDQWACNASPLILLKHIGHLSLLTDLSDTLVISKGVVDEILRYKEESLTWESFLASPKVTRLQSDITIDILLKRLSEFDKIKALNPISFLSVLEGSQ